MGDVFVEVSSNCITIDSLQFIIKQFWNNKVNISPHKVVIGLYMKVLITPDSINIK